VEFSRRSEIVVRASQSYSEKPLLLALSRLQENQMKTNALTSLVTALRLACFFFFFAHVSTAISQPQRLGPVSTTLENESKVLHNRALMLLNEFKYEEALVQLQEIESRQPGADGIKLQIALLQWELKRYDQALRSIREQINASPADVKCWSVLGDFQMELKYFDNAVDSYTKAIALGSISTNDRSNRAAAYIHLKRWELASADYLHVLKLSPDDLEMRTMLTVSYMRSGNLNDAVASIQKSIDSGRPSANDWSLMGLCHLHNREVAKANRCFALARRLDNNAQSVIHGETKELAIALCDSSRSADAVFLIKLHLGLNSRDTEAWEVLAYIHANRNEPDLAVSAYAEAVDSAPNQPRLYMARGGFLASQRMFTLAAKDFQRASELDPNQLLPKSKLVYALMKSGQFAQAIAIADDAVNKFGSNAYLFAMKGVCSRALNDLENYEKFRMQALRLDAQTRDFIETEVRAIAK